MVANISEHFPPQPSRENTRELMKGRGLLLFSSVWRTSVKHEARVFEMASQWAPNCKQKKKTKQNNRKTQKSQACDFCFLFFNQRTVCDDNVRVFQC